MEHNLLTLEFGRDTVTYEGRTVPSGTLGCEALNIADQVIAALIEPCKTLNEFISALGMMSVTNELLSCARSAAASVLDAMRHMEPFAHLDYNFYAPSIADAFSSEAVTQVRALNMAMLTRGLAAAQEPRLRKGALLSKIAPVLAQLAYSLAEYKRTMAALAESINDDGVERTPDGLAATFGAHFDASDDSLMSLANATVQYVSADEPPRLVRRMSYVSFVGLLRSDLFEGLAAGHAPRRCAVCGRWFLTLDARHTKYCGGFAPGDKRGRTCRQVGAMRGRGQRELAADHPLKAIYSRRLNTILQSQRRGKLNKEAADAMRKLAKDKLQRALSDANYARGSYEAEMTQGALLAEAEQNADA